MTTSAITTADSRVAETRLTGPAKWALRATWLAIVIPVFAAQLVAVRPYLQHLQSQCVVATEMCGEQLTAVNVVDLAAKGISLRDYGLIMGGITLLSLLVWQGVGVLLALLRSDDWMAMLVSLFLIVFSSATLNSQLLEYAATLYPQLEPFTNALNVLGELLITAFFLLFPNGHLVPRWLWWLLIVRPALALADFIPGLPILQTVIDIAFFLNIGLMLMAQVYRYRRVSKPIEKRQTRWVMFGVILGVSSVLLVTTTAIAVGLWDEGVTLATMLSLAVITLMMAAIPLSIGVAMLHAKLWDIDIVIRKTTAYGLLTGVLLLVYFSSIVILQRLLAPITGDTDVTVVLSTLLIAALFLPLRHRVQRGIDRRFFRSKYDAEQVLASFAATVRDETNLDELTAELVRVIQETMQPEFVSVWLKPENGETVGKAAAR